MEDGKVVWQTSTMEALLAGVFDGDVSVHDLLRHGDFGLGTFNGLDGEMVVLDRICYQLRADGTASTAGPDERSPFAVVTTFSPDAVLDIDEPTDRLSLLSKIDEVLPSKNIIVAVRADGAFSTMRTRTVAKQRRPYPPFVDATSDESEHALADVSGTLAGFRTPDFEEGISVAGYHLHFLDGVRQSGGHVLDFTFEKGRVELSFSTDVHLSLPRFGAFLTADLTGPNVAADIHRTE
ncbi:acetolactate decarboxylase [Frondihabitans australicus]|uniref:Alpha-acetolactate decarboxylase n=2 Tax=Frondihabitans australicus TaxID=386892 RepID=A0A495IK23_9MICO|nr:acetolactate decarboxylase [Frondihabitans australicus]